MKLTSYSAGCLVLTCIVVHTCVRIEVLNARFSYYLPRTDFGGGNPKWRVAASSSVHRAWDHTIAMKRQAVFAENHPGQPIPNVVEFLGPPYADAEQALIDTALDENHRNSELHAWVAGMGIFQYLLAPGALLWAADVVRTDRSRSVRLMAICVCLLNLTCIGLMFYRGYFTSLGW